MATNNPTSTNSARDYIEKFPGLSKRALASKLQHDYPLQFTNYQMARSAVNRLTIQGNIGVKASAKANYIPPMPESKMKQRTFHRITKKNVLWLSDIHLPNHDTKAIELAIEYGQKAKVDCVVLGGDILDMHPFSPHDGPPIAPDEVRDMFEAAEQFIAYIRSKFPKIEIVWIEGNHDLWMKRWLMKRAAILFNDPYYHLEQRLNLKQYGVQFFTQEVILQIGKLHASHGHTIVRGVFAPVNAARGVFMKTKSSYIIGHCHTTSQHIESNIKGEQIGCFSTGCLCELSPDYDPHNTKHNLGFAHILVDDNGNFTVANKMIVNYHVL